MNVKHAGVEPTDLTFVLVGIAKLQSLLHQRCLTSGPLSECAELKNLYIHGSDGTKL